MKKLLGIVVLGLCLICNNSFANEIILDCFNWKKDTLKTTVEALARLQGKDIDMEIDLKKKILHFDGNKFDIETETQRKIVAKKLNERITIDRYDGVLLLDDVSSTPVKNISRHICKIKKEKDKLF